MCHIGLPFQHKQSAHPYQCEVLQIAYQFQHGERSTEASINCESKIKLKLFCQNVRVVELGFIENSQRSTKASINCEGKITLKFVLSKCKEWLSWALLKTLVHVSFSILLFLLINFKLTCHVQGAWAQYHTSKGVKFENQVRD